MPPRLAHKKSRKGCRRCKERKVKCSEEWPVCAACARHNVSCEYNEDPRVGGSSADTYTFSTTTGSRGSSEAAESKTSSPPGLDAPYPRSLGSDVDLLESRRHAVELYLVHRYKSSVAVAFPSFESTELSEVWTWAIVDIAFDFPCLLNAIYAITSLYICITATDPRNVQERKQLPESLREVDFGQLHRMYLNKAICQQRDLLANLNADNADAVGLTAILVSIMATCLLSDDDGPQDGYHPPIQWLLMHASIANVFRNAVPFLKPEGPVVRYTVLTAEPAGGQYLDLESLNPQDLAPFQGLLDFKDPMDVEGQMSDADTLVQDEYLNAVAYLAGIFKALANLENRYRICMRVVAFGHTISRGFIQLLGQRRNRALAIFANYLAFVRYIDKYWWFRGRSQREISLLQVALPQQWQWALVWPLAVLQNPGNVLMDPRQFQEIAIR
jgi:hypothetical protein